MANNITIKDSANVDRIVKTIEKAGAVHVQVIELEGVLPYANTDLGLTGQVVLAEAGQLHSLLMFNRDVQELFVKVYDKATAPTQADVPKLVIPVAVSSQGFSWSSVVGVAFAAGISLRCSAGVAQSDTTAPATNGMVLNAGYKEVA